MKKLRIDSEGYLLDSEGNRYEIDGEPVQLENAESKENVERTIKERLARQADKIKALEAQSERTAEVERLLSEAKEEKVQLERSLSEARETAEREVANQIKAAQAKADKMQQQLEETRNNWMREQVSNAIVAAAGDRFNAASLDVVPKLLQVHKREPVKGEDGKPVEGQFVDTFKLTYKDGDKEVTDFLPLDKAIEAFASNPNHSHYLRAGNRDGSGGGQYRPNTNGNLNRSKMDAAAKAKFVGEHGMEAFQALPE